MNQSRRQLALPKSAVETEHEFVDVLLQIFLRSTMEGATDNLFEVADHDVKRRQALVNFVRPRALITLFYCKQHWLFVLCPTSALGRSIATCISIDQLHQCVQVAGMLAIADHLTPFAKHPKGGVALPPIIYYRR